MTSEATIVTKVLLDPAHKQPRYLFGCNDHSAALARTIDIDGFVDDYKKGTEYCGKPVVGGAQVPKSAVVVNCVLMARSWASKRRIQELDVAHRLDYADLLTHAPNSTPVPEFVRDTISDQATNEDRWRDLRSLLADESSRKTLSDVSNFRRTADLSYLSDYSFTPAEQYFDVSCPLSAGDVFVDCGGFDGDTTEQFVRRCPQYKSVWLFEPSEANMQKAKKRLAGVRDIHFVPKGVSDQIGRLSFNSGAGSASAVSDSGDVSIDVTTIDKEIEEPVSFIKMDLEGWELKALAGARHHIERDHSRLAIAVYHHASDFWMIPEFILSIRSDYDVFLRHYTEGWVESVMYFVPKSGRQ
jgi:FkbM family methyltransferase